jgi:hypothetical protein
MKARGKTRKLLIVIGTLQDKIGMARQYHYADTDPNGFVKAQSLLDEAFELCIKTTGEYERVVTGRRQVNHESV